MIFDITVKLFSGEEHLYEYAGIYMDKYRFIITHEHVERIFNREEVKKIEIINREK